MTDQELKDIVAAVVAELEKSGVDFDYKAEQAKDDDLVFVIRGTAPNYQGVTVTWKGLLDIITAQATQAKNDAETAKKAANTILEQVQSKGTEITNFVATSKAELETQKNESVNAVKSVYQTDLNELKGDLSDIKGNTEYALEWTDGGYISGTDGTVESFSGWKYTDYIEIRDGVKKIHIVSDTDTTFTNNAFYNADKSYISKLTIGFDVTVDVPEGARYFRLSDKSNATVTAEYILIPLSEKANRDEIPTVDTTLSIGGKSADSKVTGDRLKFIDEALDNEVITGFSKNKYIDLNSSTTDFTEVDSSSGASCIVLNCKEYDVFTLIKATGNGTIRTWAFTDVNGTILSKSELNSLCDYSIIQAPVNAKKVVLCSVVSPVIVKGIAYAIQKQNRTKGLLLSGYEELRPEFVLDKYYNSTSKAILKAVGFNITKPVFIPKGKTVTVIAHGVSNIVGMINVCDDESYTNAKCLVSSIDGDEREYSYTFESDSYVFISYRYKQDANTYFYTMYSYYIADVNDIYKEHQKTIHTQNVIKERIDFNGKNLVTFGDSIMYGASSGNSSDPSWSYNIWTDSWIRRFSAKVNATLINKAVGGACWSVGTSPDFKDIVTQVHEYCTDPSSVTPDIIFIGAGTNDWGHDCVIGETNSTDNTTLYGSLYTVFEELKTNYPNVPVVVITPINRTLADTVEKIRFLDNIRNAIFEMAVRYDHFVIDGEKMAFPMERGAYQELMLYDETHPTPLGHKMYFYTMYNLLCM